MTTDKHEVFLRMNALIKYLETNYNVEDIYITYELHAKYISVVVVQERYEYVHDQRRHHYFRLFRDYDNENNKIVGDVHVVLDDSNTLELSYYKNVKLPNYQKSHMEDEWDLMNGVAK